MLQPKKTKFRKQQKGRIKGVAIRGSSLTSGRFGIKSVEKGTITAKQIETIRVIINRSLGKTGKMWIKIFPDKSITRKAAGVRMGSGKGNPEFWAAIIRPGRILFEMDGIEINTAKRVAALANDKLSMQVKFVEQKSNINL